MTSTNDELPPPPKPRASPLDYRNTDLVSRLLAATPPYLYNMPLVPHSFFFSEMLRSLVQAKTEAANRNSASVHHRRSRKRTWTQSHSSYYNKEQPKLENNEMPPPSWVGKTPPHLDKSHLFYNKCIDKPLELTNSNNNPTASDCHNETKAFLTCTMPKIENSGNFVTEKHNQIQIPFSPVTPNLTQNSNPSEMMLPPPPPVWYPPLYPAPYGIDPLHFFIDLRVSGHIYDRKNQKECSSVDVANSAPQATSPSASSIEQNNILQLHSPNSIGTLHSTTNLSQDCFKQSRHTSAFSVPSSLLSRNIPMNLSSSPTPKAVFDGTTESGRTKFDVKSMLFDKKYIKSTSKTSTNYIMNNIGTIYKNCHLHPNEIDSEESKPEAKDVTDENEIKEETEEEREKRVKDLRALIGLELVVDYMNQAKPARNILVSEESTTDADSSDSTAVDVVAIPDDIDNDLQNM